MFQTDPIDLEQPLVHASPVWYRHSVLTESHHTTGAAFDQLALGPPTRQIGSGPYAHEL